MKVGIEMEFHDPENQYKVIDRKILAYIESSDIWSPLSRLHKTQEEFNKVIHKKGYVANSLHDLAAAIISNQHYTSLVSREDYFHKSKPFVALNTWKSKGYALFVPEDAIHYLNERPKIEYQPYPKAIYAKEYLQKYSKTIYLARKEDVDPSLGYVGVGIPHIEGKITGIHKSVVPAEDKLVIGGTVFSLQELFDNYLHLATDGWWLPCGLIPDTPDLPYFDVVGYDAWLQKYGSKEEACVESTNKKTEA